MRTRLFYAVVTLLLAAAAPAAAQYRDYDAGSVVLSAERLTGFTHTRASVGNVDGSWDHIAFLGAVPTSPADLPRIGFDVFVVNHLSLGGTIAVDHRSGDARVALLDVNGSVTDFLVEPRIGYLMMFTRTVGFWPRGGFSYFSRSYDGGDAHYISLNIEAPFVIDFTGGFGMTIGPTLDVSLDGSNHPDNGPSQDLSYTSFGIEAGLLGWL
jgi:hypothetical protein